MKVKKGDHVRFEIIMDEYDISTWEKWKDWSLKLCEKKGYEFSGIVPVGLKHSDSTHERLVDTVSDLEVFEKFCIKQKLSEDVCRLGKHLMEKSDEV